MTGPRSGTRKSFVRVERRKASAFRYIRKAQVRQHLNPERGAILAYQGPRAESYKKQFTLDLASMLAEMAGQKLSVGDFAFAADAKGTHYDACLRLGDTSYLFCNNTTKTMTDIRQNPRWRDAQIPFAALSDKFRADPLE